MIDGVMVEPSTDRSETAQMSASVLRSNGIGRRGSINVERVPRPIPADDQVVIEIAAVGVCGSDVHYYRHGVIGPYIVDEPLILGHEASGRIVEVGRSVDPDRIGERVAIEPQRPCRVCDQCKAGRYNLCPEMEFYATPPIDGAFCEFATIQADFAHAIPDSVSDEAAALMEPLSVGIWACQRAEVTAGSRVLIAGAGPIGVIIAQTARAFGASEVIITDVNADRRDFAVRHGAHRALDSGVDEVDGLEVDAFIDASGVEQAVRAGIHAVRPAGRVILVGLGADDVSIPVSFIQNKEIWLSGVFRYARTWPLAIDLVASGRVDLDTLVTGRFGLEEVDAALESGREPGQLKAMVYPGR